MRKRQVLAGVLAASALTAGVAISATGQDDASEEVSPQSAAANVVDESGWPRATPERGLAKGLSLPVEMYLVGYPEVVQWQRAQRGLWVSCMARYGFEAFDPPVPGLNPPVEYNDANMPRRYGISDATQAAQSGYHLPAEQAAEPPVWEPAAGPEEAVFLGEGPEVSDGTYSGVEVPVGGCRGEAERRLGQFTQGQGAAQVNAASWSKSMERAAVQEAIASWSACMKTKGYTFEDPYKVADSFNLTTPTASAEEIQAATADVACKAETNLIQIWHTEETALQNEQIAAKRTTLDGELAARQTIKTVVEKAISESGNQ